MDYGVDTKGVAKIKIYCVHTLGLAVLKSRNSMSIMNFTGNGTSISQTKPSLLLRSLSFISASVWKNKIGNQLSEKP